MSRSTYSRLVCFAKLIINSQKQLDLPSTLGEDRLRRKSFQISHLDSAARYEDQTEIILLLVEAPHLYIANLAKCDAFLASHLYATANVGLQELLPNYEKTGLH